MKSKAKEALRNMGFGLLIIACLVCVFGMVPLFEYLEWFGLGKPPADPLWIEKTYEPFEVCTKDTVFYEVEISIKYMLDPCFNNYYVKTSKQLKEYDKKVVEGIVYETSLKYIKKLSSKFMTPEMTGSDIRYQVEDKLKERGFSLCNLTLTLTPIEQ